MSEEEDYMSDVFLKQVGDVRPSLIHDRSKKRKIKVEDKKQANIKKQREHRTQSNAAALNELLQESLQKKITEENKGFQLLAKMGYKPGQVLGKESNISTFTSATRSKETHSKNCSIEPISISIKSDRSGLGRETALRELAERRRQLRQEKLKAAGADKIISIEEYRKRATQKAEERFFKEALRRCQQSCRNLDVSENIDTPEICWFWPEVISDNEKQEVLADAETTTDTSTDEFEYTDSEKIEMLTNYLRSAYRFCFWCGIHYKNVEDLQIGCPGLSKDDH